MYVVVGGVAVPVVGTVVYVTGDVVSVVVEDEVDVGDVSVVLGVESVDVVVPFVSQALICICPK